MPTSIVSPGDLAAYLGIDSINETRALVLLGDAQTQCEAIVAPLPEGAEAVIRSAAARAYLNVTGATQESAGPYAIQRPSGGVYLTKGERRTLRLLAGGGSGAFSINLLPPTYALDVPPWDINSSNQAIVAES